jgi:hypothetical protein
MDDLIIFWNGFNRATPVVLHFRIDQVPDAYFLLVFSNLLISSNGLFIALKRMCLALEGMEWTWWAERIYASQSALQPLRRAEARLSEHLRGCLQLRGCFPVHICRPSKCLLLTSLQLLQHKVWLEIRRPGCGTSLLPVAGTWELSRWTTKRPSQNEHSSKHATEWKTTSLQCLFSNE